MIKLIKGAAEIDKAIKSIGNRGAKLDESIQLAGLSVLAHAAEHGDTTLADRLVAALPKGSRKLALVEWMLAFGKMRKLDNKVPEEATRIKAGGIFKHDGSRTLDMDGAEAKPWHEFKPEAAISTTFDAQKAVLAVLARIKGAAHSGKDVQHKEEALAAARDLIAALTEEGSDA